MASNLTFWQAAALAQAGTPIRRVAWVDRWWTYDQYLWWLKPYNAVTKVAGAPHVILATDVTRAEFTAADWTTDAPAGSTTTITTTTTPVAYTTVLNYIADDVSTTRGDYMSKYGFTPAWLNPPDGVNKYSAWANWGTAATTPSGYIAADPAEGTEKSVVVGATLASWAFPASPGKTYYYKYLAGQWLLYDANHLLLATWKV